MQSALGQCGPLCRSASGRAINAQPFIVIEQVESDGGAVPVEEARELMRTRIRHFISQALQFHATPAPSDSEVIDLNREPPHAALKTTTGSGKSEQMRQGAARFVLEQKRRRHKLYRAIFLLKRSRRR